MVLAIALKEYRLRAGLTQSALAAALGVSTQMVGFLERGRCAPSIRLLALIMDLLDLDGSTVKAVLVELARAERKARGLPPSPPSLQRTGSDA